MTKYITTAAWAALVLGGVAFADTPPVEPAEDAVQEETTTEIKIGDDVEMVEADNVAGTIATVTIEEDVDVEVKADVEVEGDPEETVADIEETVEDAPEAE